MWELVRPLVSVHRLVLFLPDMYRLLDPSVHSVAFSVDDFGLMRDYALVCTAIVLVMIVRGQRLITVVYCFLFRSTGTIILKLFLPSVVLVVRFSFFFILFCFRLRVLDEVDNNRLLSPR